MVYLRAGTTFIQTYFRFWTEFANHFIESDRRTNKLL